MIKIVKGKTLYLCHKAKYSEIIRNRFRKTKGEKVMVINSIQYGIKQSKVTLLVLLMAPLKLLDKSKFLSLSPVSEGIGIVLSSLPSHWQRLDVWEVISWKESPECN